jgi:hypothetical protein
MGPDPGATPGQRLRVGLLDRLRGSQGTGHAILASPRLTHHPSSATGTRDAPAHRGGPETARLGKGSRPNRHLPGRSGRSGGGRRSRRGATQQKDASGSGGRGNGKSLRPDLDAIRTAAILRAQLSTGGLPRDSRGVGMVAGRALVGRDPEDPVAPDENATYKSYLTFQRSSPLPDRILPPI